MIGIFIVSHGDLAEAFYRAAVEIVGPQLQLGFKGVARGANPDVTRAEISSQLLAMDSPEGVIFLVDVCGGTPWNLCMNGDITVFGDQVIGMVGGVNLPLILKSLVLRNEEEILRAPSPVEELTRRLEEYGKSRIIEARYDKAGGG